MKLRWLPMDLQVAPPKAKGGAIADDFAPNWEHMRDKASQATILLKSMANETRLLILCQLADGERSVAQLLENIPMGQSALSQHLAVLRRERLVTTRREGQSVYYELASFEVHSIIRTLHDLFCRCT